MKNLKDLTYKECIHAKTKQEAIALCKLFHEAGLTWCHGDSYIDSSEWDDDTLDIYYFPKDGTFSGTSCGNLYGITIHDAEDFLRRPQEGDLIFVDGNYGVVLSYKGNLVAVYGGGVIKTIYELENAWWVSDLQYRRLPTPNLTSILFAKYEWKNAKPIFEPPTVELTLDEIAEKFGVDVKNIKIKKG
jgi:hypothetical protein